MRLPFPRFHGCPRPSSLRDPQKCNDGPPGPFELRRRLALQRKLHQAPTFPAQARSEVRGTQVPLYMLKSLPGSVHLGPTHPQSLFSSPRRGTVCRTARPLPQPCSCPSSLPLSSLLSSVLGPSPCSKGKGAPYCPRETRNQDVSQTHTCRPPHRFTH